MEFVKVKKSGSSKVISTCFAAMAMLATGCGGQQERESADHLSLPATQRGLSVVEQRSLEGVEGPVTLVSVKESSDHKSTKLTKTLYESAAQALRAAEVLVQSDPGVTVAVDQPIRVERREGRFDISEQYLFGGKQEFGFEEWNRRFPQADGRGVKIAIVDDGVSLGRPGLTVTSDGNPKIVGVRHLSPLWTLPLAETADDTLWTWAPGTLKRTWSGQTFGDADRARIRSLVPEQGTPRSADVQAFLGRQRYAMAFNLSPCGLTPLMDSRDPTVRRSLCASWDSHAAILFSQEESGRDQLSLFVDLNNNARIEAGEFLLPLGSFRVPAGGMGFPRDLPLESDDPSLRFGFDVALSAGGAKLHLKLPESSEDQGSHGEGVAGVAAGYRVGGHSFDGVAPGAQIVDVLLTEFYGSSPYTISSIVEALRLGGESADLVNLSYRLYFASAASQMAMSRIMNAALGSTRALYFFSAGNDGPGVGSMNRSFLYPDGGIIVGAFLNGLMSQTTFGSSVARDLVASYSSRGPALDGGSALDVLSPLAGIAPSTPDEGYQPFSGTSSASPAMAGFVARVLGQLKAEGTTAPVVSVLKAAVIASGRKLANVSANDQGAGIPYLTAAYDQYKSLVDRRQSQECDYGPLGVRGGPSTMAVPLRGIYERDPRLGPAEYVFETGWMRLPRNCGDGDASELIDVQVAAGWVQTTPALFVGTQGAQFAVRIRREILTPGLHQTEIRLVNRRTRELRAEIPITVLVPLPDQEKGRVFVDVPSGGVGRVFLRKPQGATGLVVQQERIDRTEGMATLCGRSGVYSPGANPLRPFVRPYRQTLIKQESYSTQTEGVYEVAIEGRRSHQICSENQRVQLQYQWVGIDTRVTASNFVGAGTERRVSVAQVAMKSRLSPVSGNLILRSPKQVQPITLRAQPSHWAWTSESPVTLTGDKLHRFAVDPTWLQQYAQSDSNLALILFGRLNREFGFWDGDSAGLMDWSDTLSADVEGGTTAELRILAFDDGATEILRPRNMRGWISSERPGWARVSSEVPGVLMPQGLELERIVGVRGTDIEPGLSYQCGFIPDGYRVEVPCGQVEF